MGPRCRRTASAGRRTAGPATGRTPPEEWGRPEQALLSAETRAQLAAAIDALPDAQRQVISLRDVEGWSSDEVCNVLGLSETNQRVLLHRARTKVRAALDEYVTGRER